MVRRTSPLASLPFLALCSALGLWSCGDSSESPSAPIVRTFDVSPGHLEAPGQVTVEWETSNADSIAIKRGAELLDLEGQGPAQGSIALEIEESTTFTLEASGPGGTVTEARDVSVAAQGPFIAEFDAPEMVEANPDRVATVKVEWAGVERAEILQLVPGDGAPIDLDAAAAEGSMEFSIEETTTFTLVAANGVDEVSRELTVEVIYLPVIESFHATRTHLGSGEELTLSWITTDAAYVELWVGEIQFLDLGPIEGSEAITPLVSTTVELRATNAMGTTDEATIEIEVDRPEFIQVSLDADSLWLGESVNLSWETSGGSDLSITLASTGETVCEVEGIEAIAASGCEWQPAAPVADAIFFELSNLSGVVSESFEVYVSDGPAIARFGAGPEELTEGEEVELSWTVLDDPAGNTPTLRLIDDRGGEYDTSMGVEGLSTATLSEDGPYLFTLEATTDHPLSTAQIATASVLVHPRPQVEVAVTPPIFDDALHEEVVISWTTQAAEFLTLYELVDGAMVEVLEILGADRAAGSYSLVPTEERSFLLVGANAIGTETRAEAEVRLAPTEVVNFTAEPEAFAQGQEITLRWETRMADTVELGLGTKSYLYEETDAPYIDLPSLGVSRVPLTTACGAIDTLGCAEVVFPDGFHFPFGITNNDRARVYTPGYLSFGVPGEVWPDSIPSNQTFPTERDEAGVAMAPFWDQLAWDLARYPQGNVYAALLEEDGERIFVIQWKDVAWNGGTNRSSSLNFQVVLHEDGRFDYRYDEQNAMASGLPPQILAGNSATIGFQLPDQADHGVLLFNGAGNLNGLRDYRTFSFRPLPSLPRSGELRLRPFAPSENFSITLTARRGEATDSDSVALSAARRPILILPPEAIGPAALEEEFRIGWRTFNAESVVVLDEDGEIRCTAANQDQIDEGLCVLAEAAGGDYVYTVRATGAHGSVAERDVSVRVFGDFGVASFKASSESVERGGDVLLEWLVFATESVRLFADGVEVHFDDSGALTGSFLMENLTSDVEFKLVATNDVGVEDEAVLKVELWPFTFGVQISETHVRPGDPIDVHIDARTLSDGSPIRVYGLLPLIEDTAPANRYADISSMDGVANLPTNANSVDLELPFDFPYMGVPQKQLRAFIHGYISFATNANQYVINQPIPTTVTNAVNMNMAPFWDYLNTRGRAEMHSLLLDPDTFVIQWSKFSLNAGSNASNYDDLNFQLVLHRSGSFEFRYGAMTPRPNPATSAIHCAFFDCVNEVNGSAASIGYQLPGGEEGYSLHFGGTDPAPTNPPFQGGLSNRTFRYQVFEGTYAFSFAPTETSTFSLCTETPDGTFCRELEIQVPFGFESISLSKEILGFNESTTLSWNSVGGKSLRILDGETVIWETTEIDEVDSHSIVLQPTRNTIYDVELTAGGRKEVIRKMVEMNRFSVTNSVGTSTSPGEPVTLSWSLSSNDPSLDLHLTVPLVEISNEDFDRFDISTDPEATVLIGGNANNNVVLLTFSDFSFPYFGTEHGSIRVSTDGYLGWVDAASKVNNVPLPDTTSDGDRVALAPFWDDLNSRSNGRVLAKRIDDDHYVIQWSRMSLGSGSTNANEGDLNFLVVLHRDGSFEYRYGLMRPPPLPATGINQCNPLTCERETNGSAATIGYQIPGVGAGHTLHFGGTRPGPDQPVVAGGLEDRAWRFTPSRATGPDSAVLYPGDSTSYQVCAYEPLSGEASCPPAVGVDVPWGIDLFQANPIAPLAGQPTTLSWSVQGVDSLRLLADGIELVSYAASEVPLMGSHSHTPTASRTTYTLEIISMGRLVVEEVVVDRRVLELEVSGPSGIFEPGDIAVIDWKLTNHDPGEEVVMISPMSEVEIGPNGEDRYVDVSSLPGAQELQFTHPNNGLTDVTIPFPFPYLGGHYTSAQVALDGYISFHGTGRISVAANVMLPTNHAVSLAVFWDDLHLRGGDSVWTYSPDPDTMIVQWKSISRNEGSSESLRYDLNFQVVLRSDGSFDYRYGTMAPPPPPFSHPGCIPEDCSNEANGSSATIGYQSLDGLHASTFHIGSMAAPPSYAQEVGGSAAGDGFLAFPGGLEGRTLRYTPATSGSSRVILGRTADQQVCAIVTAFVECQSHPTEVIAGSGDLMLTELMVAPSAGMPSQWFELRNLTSRTIDLEGFLLSSTDGEHRIAGSLPVAPGELITLGASTLVPFELDYVYGDDLPLSRHIDRLNLFAGQALIATAAWGIDWTIPANQTLSLDSKFHQTGIAGNADFASWCLGGPLGTPGALGEGCTDPSYDIDPVSDRPFIDIAGTGNRFYPVERNDMLARLPLSGFSPKLFGESYSRVWVSSRGYLSLHDLQPASTFTQGTPASLPRNAAQIANLQGPLISAFWETLQCGNGHCRVYYEVLEREGSEVLIVQWENFYLGNNRAAAITFQAQLWENGDVVIAFAPFQNPYPAGHGSWSVYEGAGAVIGLENRDGSVFLDGHFKRILGLDKRSIYFRAK